MEDEFDDDFLDEEEEMMLKKQARFQLSASERALREPPFILTADTSNFPCLG